MILRLLLTLPVCLTLATAAGAADVCAPKILRPLAGDTESQARAVNAAGQAVGWSKGPRGVRAVFWDAAGRPHVLSPLPGDAIARAYGLNSTVSSSGTARGRRSMRSSGASTESRGGSPFPRVTSRAMRGRSTTRA